MISKQNEIIHQKQYCDLLVRLPFSLLDALFKTGNIIQHQRLSKQQALFDLLSRHRILLLTNQDGCLQESINDLARAWHWQRQTVLNFLRMLQDNDVLSLVNENNKIRITVTCMHSHK